MSEPSLDLDVAEYGEKKKFPVQRGRSGGGMEENAVWKGVICAMIGCHPDGLCPCDTELAKEKFLWDGERTSTLSYTKTKEFTRDCLAYPGLSVIYFNIDIEINEKYIDNMSVKNRLKNMMLK